MEVLPFISDSGFMYLVLFVLLIFLNVREVKKTANLKSAPPWLIPVLTIVLLLTPVIILTLSIFFIYRHLIGIILKIKHGPKFGGFLSSSDSIHMLEGKPDHVINIILMLKCSKQTSSEDLFDKLKNGARKLHQQYTKYNSRFLTFFGYSYILKQQVNVDNCVRILKVVGNQKDTISKSNFLALLNECCNSDLPENNTVPWEVVVGKQNVNWRNDEYCYYPLFFRNGHAVGDGLSVSKVLLKMVTDSKDNKTEFKPVEDKPLERLEKLLMMFLLSIPILILIPAFCLSNFVLKAKDRNLLIGTKLRNQGFYCINIEESPEYVEKIKAIKNAIPGFSFPDVVFAAFSASLNDYFLKNSVKIEHISLGVPVSFRASKFRNAVGERLHISDVDIANKFTFVVVNTPIFVGFENNGVNEIIQRLKLIRKQSLVLRSSFEYQMLNIVFNFLCPYLPLKVIKLFMKLGRCTALFSIVPGPSTANCWQNLATVSDTIGFTPYGGLTGTSILINTYEGRMQIGVNIDKNVISCQDDVQEITDNVLKHIDNFYKHVESLKLVNWSE